MDRCTKVTYEVPIYKGTVRAVDLRQIKTIAEDFGVVSYDPTLMNTALCKSAIIFIDGGNELLRYRGCPIEELAEKCTFLEVAYLILIRELPIPTANSKVVVLTAGLPRKSSISHDRLLWITMKSSRSLPSRRPNILQTPFRSR